jgi:hypothetical protein
MRMDTVEFDDVAREQVRREDADHAERLALAAQVSPEQRELFEDAEHCRHFGRLRQVFGDLEDRRARLP